MSSFDAALSYAPAPVPTSQVPALPPPASPPRPLGPWATIGWTVLGLAAATASAILIVIAAMVWGLTRSASGLTEAQLQNVSQVAMSVGFLLFLGLIVIACRHAGWRAADYLALIRPQGHFVRLAAIALVLPLALVLGLSATGLSLTSESELPTTTTGLSITLIAVMMVAPLWEELVFRGFLYRGLAASRLGVVGAIVITSLVWAALHLDRTWIGMAELFCCGLVWGWLRWRTGSTAVTMTVHFLNNSIAGVALLGLSMGWWS